MPAALITGITGQDGPYLAKFLMTQGYEVHGLYRRVSTPNFWRLHALNIIQDINLIPGDLMDTASIQKAIVRSKPDEIYNLGAQSFVGSSFDTPLLTADVDGITPSRILESIREINPEIKFYQASTSEIFGNTLGGEGSIDEDHPKSPNSPYAAAKLHGYHLVKMYREAYGLFAVNGILFNHESPLRGLEFVTRKITNAVARIVVGEQKKVRLGNLNSRRDWGFAPEYVEAMWKMMQHPNADDFVIATGESHSVREFAEISFARYNLDWRDHVEVHDNLLRPLDVNHLLGNAGKAEHELGWLPSVKFEELANIMVESDVDRWRKYKSGHAFPWDAPNQLLD